MSEVVKPLAAGGSKDSHGTPIALIVRLGETSASEHATGYYRVCHPEPPHKWAGFSVTEDCARRLLHKGRARVVRSSQKLPDDRVVFLHWHFSEVSVEALLLAGRLLANRL